MLLSVMVRKAAKKLSRRLRKRRVKKKSKGLQRKRKKKRVKDKAQEKVKPFRDVKRELGKQPEIEAAKSFGGRVFSGSGSSGSKSGDLDVKDVVLGSGEDADDGMDELDVAADSDLDALDDEDSDFDVTADSNLDPFDGEGVGEGDESFDIVDDMDNL